VNRLISPSSLLRELKRSPISVHGNLGAFDRPNPWTAFEAVTVRGSAALGRIRDFEGRLEMICTLLLPSLYRHVPFGNGQSRDQRLWPRERKTRSSDSEWHADVTWRIGLTLPGQKLRRRIEGGCWASRNCQKRHRKMIYILAAREKDQSISISMSTQLAIDGHFSDTELQEFADGRGFAAASNGIRASFFFQNYALSVNTDTYWFGPESDRAQNLWQQTDNSTFVGAVRLFARPQLFGRTQPIPHMFARC
jgi:hypothetical protein